VKGRLGGRTVSGGYNGRGLHGQTVAVLGARIVSGELAQGAVLDLPVLGSELDLSLTVLREAIKVLTAKGLLEARQKRGTTVLPRARWNLSLRDALVHRHRDEDPVPSHARVVDAVRARDPQAASAAARDLLGQATADAARLLGDRPA
jgi:GntR family galactonate operon transcriptional repressor